MTGKGANSLHTEGNRTLSSTGSCLLVWVSKLRPHEVLERIGMWSKLVCFSDWRPVAVSDTYEIANPMLRKEVFIPTAFSTPQEASISIHLVRGIAWPWNLEDAQTQNTARRCSQHQGVQYNHKAWSHYDDQKIRLFFSEVRWRAQMCLSLPQPT